MKDAMDVIFTAKIRPEHPVGPAFGKDLIKKDVFLDRDIGAHAHQPMTVFLQGRLMNIADEDRIHTSLRAEGTVIFSGHPLHLRSA